MRNARFPPLSKTCSTSLLRDSITGWIRDRRTGATPALELPAFATQADRLAYYERHRLDSEQAMLDCNDVRAGRETPNERRAREAAEKASLQGGRTRRRHRGRRMARAPSLTEKGLRPLEPLPALGLSHTHLVVHNEHRCRPLAHIGVALPPKCDSQAVRIARGCANERDGELVRRTRAGAIPISTVSSVRPGLGAS